MVTEFSHSLFEASSQADKALQLLNQGEYQAALRHFALAQDAAQDPDNLVNQAVCLIHLNQAAPAQQLCDRALTLDPKHPQAWLFRGVALHRLGQYQEAYACYNRALGEQRPQQTTLRAASHHHRNWLKSVIKHIKNTKLLRLWVN